MADSKSSSPALTGVRIDDSGGLSRGDLILKGALVAGALYGVGAIGPYVARALAARSDVDILNFLLLFEYLQETIYNRGNSEVNRKGEKMPLKGKEKELLETLSTEEDEHVAAVKEMIEKLDGKPDEKGDYAFSYLDFATVLRLAEVVERAAIGAYNGAIPLLESAEARELTFSIVQVEGRHAATLLIGMQEDPAPEAFDLGQSEQTSRNSVVQFTGTF